MLILNRVVACAALVVMTSGAHAYQCKSGYQQAEAHGNIKPQARKSARAIWASTVKNKYGLQWSSWDIAAAKSQDCNWTGNQFYCILKAKPCLYVVQ
jgi:hypothetical protein